MNEWGVPSGQCTQSRQKMRSGSQVPHDTSLDGHVSSLGLGTFMCDTHIVLPAFHRLVRSTQWDFSEKVVFRTYFNVGQAERLLV